MQAGKKMNSICTSDDKLLGQIWGFSIAITDNEPSSKKELYP
jgi:hypothetical protein